MSSESSGRSSRNASVSDLLNTVIKNGYCVGCGACAAIPNSPMKVGFSQYGLIQASERSESPAPGGPEICVASLCPFSDSSVDEDRIGYELFGCDKSALDPYPGIGYYRALYAGHVRDDEYRRNGSSGGMGSWLLARLLQSGQVDGIAHVHRVDPAASQGKLFSFAISRSVEQIKQAAKSHYYPVEMSDILGEIRQNPGRYAVVGIPCFIKAVRLLTRQDPVLRERIRYTIGLFCGHLKSTRFAGLFAWQHGIHPDDIRAIDFRHKLPDSPADQYGVRIDGVCNGQEIEVTAPNKEHFGYNWGHGFFKYRSCDYCDDVVAETADVSIGDAWLPEYVNDWQGTNVVVARAKEIQKLLEDGIESGALVLETISAEQLKRSQNAGFRHRTEGLAFRLDRRRRRKEWCPGKRVKIDLESIPWRRRAIYRMREVIAERSHKAFAAALKQNDFEVFRRAMRPWLRVYGLLYRDYRLFRMVGKMRRWCRGKRPA